MILLAGLKYDPIIKYIYQEISSAKLGAVFVDQQALGSNIFINDMGIYAKHDEWFIEHSQIQVVFNRLVGYPKQHSQEHIKELELLIHYLDDIYEYVLNKPSSGMSNNSKPLQLSILKLKNCKIPNSYVCAGRDSPQEEHLIFKSISSLRSIVNTVETCKFVREPVLFQNFCPGDNVRVHCLGDHYVAINIKSSAIDYRYEEGSKFEQIELPKKIFNECLSLNRQLDLSFSGIDFIVQGGSWTLLEINPAPGYAYFETKLKEKPISKMLINYMKSQGNK